LWKVKGFSSHRVQTVVLVRVMVLVPVTGMVKVWEPEVLVEVVTGPLLAGGLGVKAVEKSLPGQVVVTMVMVLVVPGFTGV
jgi:hypothetical protein